MDIDYLFCPFCYARVPRGAQQCHGCGAQVEYQMPDGLYALVLVIALVARFTAVKVVPSALVWMSAPVAVLALVGLSLPLRKQYRHHFSFRPPNLTPKGAPLVCSCPSPHAETMTCDTEYGGNHWPGGQESGLRCSSRLTRSVRATKA